MKRHEGETTVLRTVDCLSAQTVGKGYLLAVTLMWSPSVYKAKPWEISPRTQDDPVLLLTLEFYSSPSIETSPSGASRIIRHTNPQFHAVWQEHRPEGKGVGADRSDEQGWDLRVDKGATSRELWGASELAVGQRRRKMEERHSLNRQSTRSA